MSATTANRLAPFANATREWWVKVPNQRTFLDTVSKELGLKQLSDWYGVYRRELVRFGGKGLLREYDYSLSQALKMVYPEHQWQIAKFVEEDAVGHKSKHDTKTLLAALEKAQVRLGITQIEDWYSVTMADLREVGFPINFRKSKFVELLSIKYPDHSWEMIYMLKGRYAQQKRLERAVRQLFPNVEIKANVRKEAGLLNPDTRAHLELDLFLPAINLAFEYQDLHHYQSTSGAYSPLHVYQERDRVKQRVAQNKGITLVIVPCWWDGRDESLIATIKKLRPDLLSQTQVDADPISEVMPPRFLEQYQRKFHVEDIGEPISACFLTGQGVNPTDWWLFEKYDGVRGFWNPLKRAFYSRHGNKLPIPQEIIDSMPDTFLDGELWFGRDNFQEALKLSTRTQKSEIDWKKFNYMVFDAPKEPGTYAERYAALQNRFPKQHPYMQLAPVQICRDMMHLEQFFQDIMDKGGEGVILRDPNAQYEAGRSSSFLKHKKFRDAEAKIVRSVGTAQWECMLPNGVTFVAVAGTSEFLKRWQPKEGDIVSFKHRGYLLGSKKPKAPCIYRLRPDLSWDDVVNNFKEKSPRFTTLPMRQPFSSHRPKGFWLDRNNRREFLCKFAEEAGFDPFIPENWKNVTYRQIAAKGGKQLVESSTLQEVLQNTFPELEFNLKVKKKPSKFWMEAKNCRAFFDEVAKEAGFNPLEPSAWHSFKLDSMLEKKGGVSIKKHGGFKAALRRAYPDLVFTFAKTDHNNRIQTMKQT